MLTINQLQYLSLSEKAQYISDKGMFMNIRTEKHSSIKLFWMDYYYAEVVSDIADNQIEDIVYKINYNE